MSNNSQSGGPSWYRQEKTREAAELLRGVFHDRPLDLCAQTSTVSMRWRGQQWEVSMRAKGYSATGWGESLAPAVWDAFAVWYVETGLELAGLRFRRGRLMVEGEGGSP